MEPKFQSSFIPKGPAVTTAPNTPLKGRKSEGKSFFGYIALLIFSLSVIFAVGVFGYKYYLKYSIQRMGGNLENARATLQSDVIRELTRLDNRIISSKELIARHQIVSPLFEFLEIYTPQTVRFSDFNYSIADQGIQLSMKGEARGYAALAFQADIFDNSQYFENPVFSDLTLNEKGDVTFSFKAILDPDLVSYQRKVQQIGVPPVEPVEQVEVVEEAPVSTSTDASLPSTQNQTQN
ncbi:MAG: hypothetical protein CO183_01555 [Candidatus Zambryskibacteria bacterium CG_4_9_14_3_um_filter_42_9]|uniref:PilN domain-containing protein n=1 Tax=Candidatus Zambryskibacteria bacterium CG22_combo_CG10-13_8_21_14_all_42_17 TaxID=1975118 RepID=A0A2H0BEC6_9BACT|nr:MAG: hypothetical protein COX06_00055 [Candidatus Zambryskibacteria bacterium CG22_combo_CG10-13_8_21_14_all_42_17]PJA36813.1 MAG: hypothetical protein CO183_01555 [Candidatus Zambryskibacteria bacterium CG_4_9_14_3_um_filter_42_9]